MHVVLVLCSFHLLISCAPSGSSRERPSCGREALESVQQLMDVLTPSPSGVTKEQGPTGRPVKAKRFREDQAGDPLRSQGSIPPLTPEKGRKSYKPFAEASVDSKAPERATSGDNAARREECRCNNSPRDELNFLLQDAGERASNDKDKTLVEPVYRFKEAKTTPISNFIEFPKRPESMVSLEEILIVGAGPSTCVPMVACLSEREPRCLVCLDAVGRVERSVEYTARYGGPPLDSPLTNRNKRSNPSAVLRYRHSEGSLRSVLVDCGKSFYANTDIMLKAGVGKLDGIVLTHGHADAIFGLDDLRHWSGSNPSIQPTVEIWCDQATFTTLQETFSYIVNPKSAKGSGVVPALHFNIFTPGDTIKVGELQIQTVKVIHGAYPDGRPYHANGFICEGLTYLSDLSSIPPESMDLIRSSPNNVLVADCVDERGVSLSHYLWPQARDLHKLLRPKSTILVGMSHHIDYYRFQRAIDEEAGFPTSPGGIIDKLEYSEGRILVGFDGMLLKWHRDH